jgi:hypothetical protein
LLAKQSFNPDNIALFLLDNLPNLTLFQALLHASVAMERKLVVDWVPSCDLEDSSARENPEAHKKAWKLLKVSTLYIKKYFCVVI